MTRNARENPTNSQNNTLVEYVLGGDNIAFFPLELVEEFLSETDEDIRVISKAVHSLKLIPGGGRSLWPCTLRIVKIATGEERTTYFGEFAGVHCLNKIGLFRP